MNDFPSHKSYKIDNHEVIIYIYERLYPQGVQFNVDRFDILAKEGAIAASKLLWVQKSAANAANPANAGSAAASDDVRKPREMAKVLAPGQNEEMQAKKHRGCQCGNGSATEAEVVVKCR